jgi:hypothetical protein
MEITRGISDRLTSRGAGHYGDPSGVPFSGCRQLAALSSSASFQCVASPNGTLLIAGTPVGAEKVPHTVRPKVGGVHAVSLQFG